MAQGIEPEELLIKDINYFRKNMTPADASIPQYAERVCMHYENNRQVKLRIVRDERKRIAQQQEQEHAEMQAVMGTSTLPGIQSDGNKSSDAMEYTKAKIQAQLAQEQKAMEKMQQRQIRKIKNLVSYEIRKQQTTSVMQAQIQRQQDRAEAEDREKLRQIAVKEKHQLEVQQQRRIQAAAEEAERQRLNKVAFGQQQQMAKRLAEEQERKRQEMHMRAMEREAKQMEKRRQLEAILRAQSAVTQRKADDMARRDKERTRAMAEQRETLHAKMKSIQERARERTAAVQRKQVALLERQRIEFKKKEELAEERRLEFEHKREMDNESRRQRAREKGEQIEQTKALADAILQSNRQRVMESERSTNERLAERARTLEREREQRVLEEQERNRQRRAILENAQLMQTHKAMEIQQKREAQDDRTQKHFAERALNQKRQKLELELQQRDRQEHVERMKKMQVYRRDKLMQKIKAEGDRVDMIKSQWAVLADKRAELRAQEQMQQQALAATFARLTKLNAFDGLDPDNPDFSSLGINIPGLSLSSTTPSRLNSARSTRSNSKRRSNSGGDSTFLTTQPLEPSRPMKERPRTKTPRARRAQ